MPEVTRTLPVTNKFFMNRHSEASSEKLVFIAVDDSLEMQSCVCMYRKYTYLLYLSVSCGCSPVEILFRGLASLL